MPDDTNNKPKGFPDISAKLSAPPKKSLFERQKAEAEAKRAREQAETAAVYEDFVKSFEDEDAGSTSNRPSLDGRANAFGSSGRGGPAKRHFTGSSRSSGPGTLGPAPPPPSLSRKRTHEGFQASLKNNRESGPGALGFESVGSDAAAAFRDDDDEDERAADAKEAEKAAAKPTLYLASLPPATSPSVIKSLIPSTLVVDGVKILRPPSQSATDRKSGSAIVTLANESAASDIDSAVSALQNKYLGWGYNLSISRHLSSAAISSAVPVTVGLSPATSLPFGAKTISQQYPGGSLNRAPPPGSHRGAFAPPPSYGTAYARGPSTQVEVKTPSDLKQMKLIHKTLESLLDYGPEFEALLMSRPEVQKEEKWAWLWDSRSPGGVYYRWKLWEVLTNMQSKGTKRGKARNPATVFEGGSSWLPPESNVKFEYITRMDEFVSDDDYNSSDEEHSDAEDERRNLSGAPPTDGLSTGNEGLGYMNPIQKAKLTHLIARLPTTHAKLRKGDVARVTAFAIEHAGAGADEVVQLIVSNILDPLAYTGANPNRESEKGLARGENNPAPEGEPTNPAADGPFSIKENLDTSSAKLVGLYLVSDILSSSATSGVRHAWRYRQLFESALKTNQVFEHLGRLEKDLKWGRLKAEKWKRSVGSLLHLWEGWCVFPQQSQEHFAQIFEKPPLTEKELREEKEKAEADRASNAFAKGKSRWRTLDEEAAAASGKFDPSRPPTLDSNRMDIDQKPTAGQADLDGEPMSDIDGVPMEDSDLEDEAPDGEPLEDDDSPPMEETGQKGPEDASGKETQPGQQSQQQQHEQTTPSEPQRPMRKPRPKAEDMFADSDSE